ncbi:MAG: TPM domain-containing protein [Candidatus Brocadiaceae baterium WH-1]|uniref:TPM domain-containing protein n=1 Tax=Candidatus Loosdrechtia sp. TaxID=3101272 RepID=UPI003A6BC39B|nr:MAG: TPM domain-containing protein [Candidatus Jettenia sp. AMX2]
MHKKLFYRCFLILFLLCLCLPAQAQEIPVPRTYVEDRANIIRDTIKRNLNGYLQELEQKTGAQMIVLTVTTTGGITIENYAIELAGKWRLGQEGKDNGVLIVIAKNDRAYRIEVGYGLEGALPDSYCGTVGRTYFVPNFQRGNYSEGIYQGVIALVHRIAEEKNITITGMPAMTEVRKNRQQQPLFLFLILFIVLPFFLNHFFFRHSRRRYWRGGTPIIFGGPRGFGGSTGGFGGFGSFGGGGGGSFGGGGVSGRW